MDIVKFYRGDPNAPKTTQGARLGANGIITCNGKLLLEKRRDCDLWGLVGGGVKRKETPAQALVREVYEELGLRIKQEDLVKLGVYGEPGRIAAYRDGSIWRMVVVVFSLVLAQEPEIVLSKESEDMRFFTPEERFNFPSLLSRKDQKTSCSCPYLGNSFYFRKRKTKY
jgi:8-oxo-dGTP pyrophosphatase MutT (NUDIX family)